MKNQRSILVLVAAFAAAAIAPVTFAQAPDKTERPLRGQRANPAERAEKLREHFAEKLNLTADQRTRIEAIHAAERDQRQAIIADKSMDRDQKREKISALREATVQQVDSVLTPDQLTQAREMRAKAKERGEMRRDKMEKRGAKMKELRERRQNPN